MEAIPKMAKKTQEGDTITLGKCVKCNEEAEFKDIQAGEVVNVCRKHVVTNLP
jgi:hypothetical protein